MRVSLLISVLASLNPAVTVAAASAEMRRKNTEEKACGRPGSLIERLLHINFQHNIHLLPVVELADRFGVAALALELGINFVVNIRR